MFILRAYAEREDLSDRDLERLRGALVDEVQRFRLAIRGYSTAKMAEHGIPFLAQLERRVNVVDGVIRRRVRQAKQSE